MTFSKKIIALGFVLGMSVASSFAADNHSIQLEDQLKKVTAQTIALQKQVESLQKELNQMRQTKASTTVKSPVAEDPIKNTKKSRHSIINEDINLNKPILGNHVISAPYVGRRTAYDASDLIVIASSMNEDLTFLRWRSDYETRHADLYEAYKDSPVIALSGKIESQLIWQDPYVGSKQSDIDLSSAELDTYAQVSDWAFGYMTFNYDDSPLDPTLEGNGNREGNSRLYVNRGFLTIGNLNKSPLYLTMGQIYVPFGYYSSYFVSSTLPQILGRIKTRAVELGFAKGGFNASVYAFSGNTIDDNRRIDNGGANIDYKFKTDKFTGLLGASVVNDLAESQGLQDTGAGLGYFQGFAINDQTEQLLNRVPAGDVHGRLTLGKFDFNAEYLSALNRFDPNNLTFNHQGARPKALHVEGAYNFRVYTKPSSFALSYDETWQALAAGLPKNSYRAVWNISLWKNTIESIEYRHDVNYASTDTAGGICLDSNDNLTFCSNNAQGSAQNTILAQIGVYF